jgi:hypothetical protein
VGGENGNEGVRTVVRDPARREGACDGERNAEGTACHEDFVPLLCGERGGREHDGGDGYEGETGILALNYVLAKHFTPSFSLRHVTHLEDMYSLLCLEFERSVCPLGLFG